MSDQKTTLPHRLEQLVTGGNALVGELRLDRVLQAVVDLARSVIGAQYAALGLLAPDRMNLSLFVTSGIDEETVARLGAPPRGHGILGHVIQQGTALRLPDLKLHPASAGFPPGHPPMKSFLGVPVVGSAVIVGNLYLTEKLGGGPFTDEDERLAVLLASMAAVAMENARHHEESARLIVEVQALMRSREQFFAMVNHELRNSLAAVLGWSEMLVRRKDPATVPRAAFEVLESAESASALIGDLLDLSRLDEDRLRPVIAPVDPLSIINHAITRVTPAATARGVPIDHHPHGPLPVLETDGHRVEQILVNLLNNAIRHSPTGSTVAIRSIPGEHGIRVVVQDCGPGVQEDQLPHIFDIYYSKPGAAGAGVGLGLPLARRLAQLLGGDISAGNLPAGGAEFTLVLPQHAP